MYKIIVTNSFSISMLPPTDKMGVLVEFRPISAETVRSWCNQNNVDVVSAIGHADTARIVSGLLGVELPANRISVKMTGMESLVVAHIQAVDCLRGRRHCQRGRRWNSGR